MNDEPEDLDWDALEKAGHEFTLVATLSMGTSKYVCENCGALLVTGHWDKPKIEVWYHPHRDDRSCEQRRGLGPSLRVLMERLVFRQLDRIPTD